MNPLRLLAVSGLLLVLLLACGTPAAKCTTTSCTGCCDSADNCQAGTVATACGAGGHLCIACPSGQVCETNACVQPPAACTASTCPGGCCTSSGVCQAGTSTAACGSGGQLCTACGGTQTCTSQHCQ